MKRIALLLAAFAAQASAQTASSIDGRWINPDRTVIIGISPCGATRCGIVDWATEQAKQDAAKHDPTLVGSALLTDLTPSGATKWKGRLWVPDQNLRVSAKIQLIDAEHLKVAGCALGGLMCNSQVWEKAPATNP